MLQRLSHSEPGEVGKARVRAARHATLDPEGRADAAALRKFRRRFIGETALVVGNGPSLGSTPLGLADFLPSFGTNRIFLGADTLRFSPTFYVAVNALVIEQSRAEIAALPMPRFLPARHRAEFPGTDVNWIHTHGPTAFSHRPDRYGFFESATVTHVVLQLAYFMGFRRVLLVGVDHRFAQQGTPHTVVTGDGPDPSHFDPRYFSNGFRWQLPDLDASERGYRRAGQAFARAGGEIVDCTVDGALQVFRKSSLERELDLVVEVS